RRPTLVGDVVQNWLSLAGERHTIAFCCDIAHAHALAERFVREGVKTCVITDKTATDERDDLMGQFRVRETQVLCNVGIASYGFDCPSVDCIVLARPTKSLVLHLQQLGRGLRPYPEGNKKDCLVLDHAGNIPRHGMAEDGQFWTLETGTRVQDRQAKKRERKSIECANCRYLFSSSRECPNCGWEIPVPKRDVAHVEADLVRITKERRQLFDDRKGFYLELHAIAEIRGYKAGWPKINFKEKYGDWPPLSWDQIYDELKPITPTPATSRWVQSRMIRFAKGQKHG
ncbi:MAG: hypothetical protein E2O55_05060, partial [Gammaproteobacteria bacterium]